MTPEQERDAWLERIGEVCRAREAPGPGQDRCFKAGVHAMVAVMELEEGERERAAVAEAVQPVVIQQPVMQRPLVAIPGGSGFAIQRGAVPGTYYQPGPGGPRWFSVQPLP
jgi:hypothetical protein